MVAQYFRSINFEKAALSLSQWKRNKLWENKVITQRSVASLSPHALSSKLNAVCRLQKVFEYGVVTKSSPVVSTIPMPRTVHPYEWVDGDYRYGVEAITVKMHLLLGYLSAYPPTTLPPRVRGYNPCLVVY